MTSNFSQLSTDALSPGQLPESVKALLKRAHINRYPKRTTIVDAGTESKSLYLILKGSVSIILREDDEREIVVAYLNPGDFLGKWVSLNQIHSVQQKFVHVMSVKLPKFHMTISTNLVNNIQI
jgi:signal-transduction protein with cAMP-binding, CBS, and nucleotidyltransferase domain